MEAFGAGPDAFGARPRVSSNTFATGSNQNCGNVLSDTPTTRVAQAPGGRSSISLGWSDAREDDGRRGGGRVLGGRDGPVLGGQARSPRSPADYGGSGPRGEPGGPGAGGGQLFSRDPRDSQVGSAAGMGSQRVSGNAYACGANQNSGNVLGDVSSTRVNKPPGGASSMNLSWGDERRGGGAPERAAPQSYAGQDGYGQAPMSPSQQAPFARSPGAARSRDWQTGQAPSPCHGDARHEAMGGPRGPLEPADGARGPPFSGASPRGGGGPPILGGGDQIFGTRTRPSSNNYANGADQNCGNVLTDVPTTRVLRPPGGSSAMSLSWEDKPLASPQQNRHGARQDSILGQNPPQDFRGQAPPQEFRGQGSPREAPRGQGGTFGQRPRVSSNTFACGADQNCGNVISDTPTTRVLRPPGGASSLRLG